MVAEDIEQDFGSIMHFDACSAESGGVMAIL